MTRVNSDLCNPGYGAVGIFVEAYETANNGTTSTIHVRGGYYNNSPYEVYASTAYISLSGRSAVSFTTASPGDHVLDEYDVTVAHASNGSAVNASYSCYGTSTYPNNSVNPTVTISTSANPTYAVTYAGNGGTTPSGQTKIYGISLTLNGSSSRTGYTFQGWSGSDGKTYSNGSSFTGNYALTLTAVWKINTWTVSYNANGGTGAPANQIKTYGVALTLSTSKPTKTLYDFVSWYGSDKVTYASGASFAGNYALTLTATWKLAYIPPTITSMNAYHCDSSGNAADDGTYIKVIVGWKVDRTISSTNIGKGIITYYKLPTDSAYTTVGTTAISGVSGTTSIIIGGSLNGDYTYNVQAYVYDSYMGVNHGTSQVVDAQGAEFLMDFTSDGNVCFGGAAVSDYHMCIKENGSVVWFSDTFEWKPAGSATGTTQISLPSSFKELLVYVSANNAYHVDFHLARPYLTANAKLFSKGYFLKSSSASSFIQIGASSTVAYLNYADTTGSNVTSSSTITVYYR